MPGPEPGRGMGAARPDGAVFAMVERKIVISKFRVFILFIIYEKCRKFNELFRRDIPMDFVQLQLTHAKFNIFNCTKEEKKLRMDHHTKLFGNYSI